MLSKTIELRFVLLLLLLLRNEFRHSDQDQTRSVLDRIRHDQGFPNSWRKIAGCGRIFRHEFGKSGQDQTRSGLAGWGWIFRHEFGKSGQDQTRSGFGWWWIFRHEFGKCGQDQSQSGFGWLWITGGRRPRIGAKGFPAARRDLEGEPRSGSTF